MLFDKVRSVALVSLKDKKTQVKIIYYGPGRGGKTPTLFCFHHNVANPMNAEMAAIKKCGERTFF